MNSASSESFADGIARELPYLRRYARALTGSQKSGDAYAAATLEAMLDDPDLGDRWKVASTAARGFGKAMPVITVFPTPNTAVAARAKSPSGDRSQ